MMDDAFDHPLLDDASRATLRRLREHPHAPRFRNATGSRLRSEDLDALAHAERVALHDPTPEPLQPPAWIDHYVEYVTRTVPYFRNRRWPTAFIDRPTTSRRDLSDHITSFIPDDVAADRLIVYETSGVTGHRLTVPSHPIVAATYLALHRRALRRLGLDLVGGPERTAGVLLGMQERCFTYASVMPQLGGAGFAKINLHPDDWRSPADRARFIDDLAPQIIAGDPISLRELLTLDVTHRPTAVLSTSMQLLVGLRTAVAEQLCAPVLDIYSLNEVGPVAVFDEAAGGHVLLQPNLYVEILRPDGRLARLGERGEITVTGGFNHVLPLVRYRTGDYASWATDGRPVLVDLVGRAPIRFRRADGRWINNHEIGHALAHLPISQFRAHQRADRSFALVVGAADHLAQAAVAALNACTGQRVDLVEETHFLATSSDKLMQYSSDLTDALVAAVP
jgi:phenylacetate-CoA ligase